MSPWRMMNEWGIPSVELHSLVYQYYRKLAEKKMFLPDLAFAGGFSFEDQMFKGLALGAPFVKLIAYARAPLAAAMVAKNIGKAIEAQSLPISSRRTNCGTSWATASPSCPPAPSASTPITSAWRRDCGNSWRARASSR
jgi:glutamate synthase domain-containing protein 2